MYNPSAPLQESRKPIPHVHLEVRWRSAGTVMPPLNSSLLASLLLLLPHSCDKESPFRCQGNRLFPWRCWNTWEGQGGFVSPYDEGFSPCMFNRQTYGPKPNSRAHLPQPDYVQWSFWHLHFASFITLCSSHRGHLSYCCSGLLMSTAETTDRQTKQGRHTCVSVAVTENTPGQINTQHTHTLWNIHKPGHTILFVSSRISAPTHHCLA